MNIYHTLILVVALGSTGLTSASAALVESLNNTVTNGTIVVDSSRSGWSGLTGFITDPNEGSTIDWHQITIANDSTNYYFRYVMNDSPALIDGNFRIFFDTDQNRSTGYIGGASEFSVGAEFMIEGATLYQFTGGTQDAWSWNWLGLQSYNDGVTDDFVISTPIASFGTNTFNFMLFSDGFTNSVAYRDFYVDSSNQGASGGWLQYTTVPEPGVSLLLGLGLGLALLGFRKKKS